MLKLKRAIRDILLSPHCEWPPKRVLTRTNRNRVPVMCNTSGTYQPAITKLMTLPHSSIQPGRQLQRIYLLHLHLHLSRSLADRWDTTGDFTINFLHSSRFSAFRSMMLNSRPVHSLMLSSHRFLCLPLRLPSCPVPCRIVLASPDDRVTCSYHFSLRLFTEVRRSSFGPIAFSSPVFTSLLVM